MKILPVLAEKIISAVFGFYLIPRLNQERRTASPVVVYQTAFICVWFRLFLFREENTAILKMHLEI